MFALIIRYFGFALLVIALSGCLGKPIGDIRMLDYGIYDAVVVTRGSPALGQDPVIVSVAGVTHRETTLEIPARANTYFGFRVDPATLPSSYQLRIEYEHPPFTPPGQSDPETLSFDEYEITPARSFNGVVFWYFLEGAEYEMVPGQWTFRAIVNGSPVAEKTFTVSR